MILFAGLLFVTNFLDDILLTITYPFLEGSSEGKSIILFGIMGSMLLFYPLFKQDGIIANKISSLSPLLKFDGQKYLKFMIIIIFFTYLAGLLLEIWIRTKFGVSLFTIFVSYNSSVSTTSLTHSHILKSILGALIHYFGVFIPSQINTGVSLAQYIPSVAFVIFIVFPVIYLTGLIALSQKRDLYKVLLAFAITISLIGMLDGGLFSTPALLGLLILLSVYYMKKPFSPKYISKPIIIILLLIILRVSLGLIGTNTEFHEITIVDPLENIDLNGYNVLSIEKEENKMIVKVPGDTNDKVLLLQLTEDLKGKCRGFFISWNIYSWT